MDFLYKIEQTKIYIYFKYWVKKKKKIGLLSSDFWSATFLPKNLKEIRLY